MNLTKRYQMKAQGKKAEIWIYQEIGGYWGEGITAKQFADDLKNLGELDEINLRINSPGGDVFEGITIYNLLAQNAARVTVDIDGLAASIASVIAMAGDEIRIADNAMMMVHPAWGFAMGNAADMRKTADMLEKVDASITSTYVKRTKRDEKEIRKLMEDETWMTSKEALAYGFVDKITEALEIAACFDLSKFKYRKSMISAPAALGNKRGSPARFANNKNMPGVSDSSRDIKMRTIGEQIAGFEAKRQSNVARKEALREKASEEGRVMNDAEAEEFDGLDVENESIDKELVRLKRHEKQIQGAAAITNAAGQSPEGGSRARSIVTVKGPDLPKGTAFIRYAQALAASYFATGQISQGAALEFAKDKRSWRDQTPQVERVLSNMNLWRIKNLAVDPGTTTADGWASELADYRWMAQEFIDFLRPQAVIGKIQGLRRVPFNIKMPLQDTGASVGWVGEVARKPVTSMHFDTATLRFHKAAGIAVVSEELVRFSSPAIEELIRTDLSKSMVQFLDEQFTNPAIAASGDISPASITNAAGTSGAAGTSAANFRTDLKTALTAILAAEIDPTGLYILMRPVQALAMSQMVNALGGKEFPDIRVNGGTLEGFQVVTSTSVPSGDLIYLQPSEIMLADDAPPAVDVSRETSIVMDDGGSPASTTAVSMFQTNQVAIRVEQYITWKRRRDAAVYVKTGCAYV
jgi:ATP-dependent Clp endopeptidase proteolytic subunit ClpP/HK97 family phage major capsid protein